MHKRYSVLSLLAVAAVSIMMTGCGEGDGDRLKTVPVSGTLYVNDKPTGPVVLQLVPEPADPTRPIVNGYVKQDGSFALQTYEEGDGAPPGQYKVGLMMDPMSPGGVPVVEPQTIEIADASDPVTLDIKLQSSGQQTTGMGGAPPSGQ